MSSVGRSPPLHIPAGALLGERAPVRRRHICSPGLRRVRPPLVVHLASAAARDRGKGFRRGITQQRRRRQHLRQTVAGLPEPGGPQVTRSVCMSAPETTSLRFNWKDGICDIWARDQLALLSRVRLPAPRSGSGVRWPRVTSQWPRS